LSHSRISSFPALADIYLVAFRLYFIPKQPLGESTKTNARSIQRGTSHTAQMVRAVVPGSTPLRRVTRSQSRELDEQFGIAFRKTTAIHDSGKAKAGSSRKCRVLYSALSLGKSCDRASYLCT